MGRDHSCEVCGRGGFNDPDGVCEWPTDEVGMSRDEYQRAYAAGEAIVWPVLEHEQGECDVCDVLRAAIDEVDRA